MNLRLLFLIFAILGPACAVPNESPIRILNGYSLVGETAADCTASEVGSLAGLLDISSRSSYYLQFTVTSGLQVIETTTAGATVADGSRNNFVAKEVVFTYSSTPALAFELESVPIHFVIAPGTEDNFVRMNLISTKAAQVLRGAVLPGDSYDLRVGVQFRGALQSGLEIESTSVTYPIQIVNSNFQGCPAGRIVAPNGACGDTGGQDGVPTLCCDPAVDCAT